MFFKKIKVFLLGFLSWKLEVTCVSFFGAFFFFSDLHWRAMFKREPLEREPNHYLISSINLGSAAELHMQKMSIYTYYILKLFLKTHNDKKNMKKTCILI